ncbi:asparagine--tRNA ligase [Microbulbifer halophilus]|uniref:Asparagine--tRNA ligase n=1 Tax=Microbulbifer halophilus TaxID=453963 RepID=A0ABW5EGY0_9GAMM|nr:asparagine--tRNA ligase [Microbulbifer halophilus]MCW8127358.1 asparagine--tRNA ligase [Microbulbifer halophilus]
MQVESVDSLLKSPGREGSEARIQGWIRTRRDSKAGLSFLAVHDGSGFDPIQVVVEANIHNYESEVLRLTTGCAVDITGTLKPSQGKGQAIELLATEVQVVGWVEDPDTYPMSPKRHTMEHLREHAHLRPRTNVGGAVTRVRNCIAQALHRFFHENGFNWIHTPILTASDCEGAGELFRVSTLDQANLPLTDKGEVDYSQDFFGEESFLTVSGQLNVESYCLALSKVYTFGPTFRAENSNTTRHLAEFWMVEPEIAFADLADTADLSEKMLKYVCKAVLEERADDMTFFAQRIDKEAISRLENIIEHDFARINYSEAIEILENCKEKFEFPVSWGIDMASEHERYLAEQHFKKPVIVMNYPKDIKAFYMRMNDDGKTVSAMDVLAPGIGEIIGGSQREERLEKLDERMDEMEIPKEHLDWYRDLRRYGTVPHAGFGLGFDRIVSYVTGMGNIRDVIPFPRTPKNIAF